MAGLLHHISVHPHVVVIQTLGLISSKVLQLAQGLPPAVQAEAFSDAALLQVNQIFLIFLRLQCICPYLVLFSPFCVAQLTWTCT